MLTKKVKRFPNWFRRLSLILSCLIAVVAAAPIVATVYVNLATSSDRYSQLTKVPKEDLAIVFGAGLLADGTPTPMLSDRVEAQMVLLLLCCPIELRLLSNFTKWERFIDC